jgi:hypothetical protein
LTLKLRKASVGADEAAGAALLLTSLKPSDGSASTMLLYASSLIRPFSSRFSSSYIASAVLLMKRGKYNIQS